MAPGTQQDPALTHSPLKCLWITQRQPANARLERAETLEIDISQGFFLGKINPHTFNCRTILPAQNQPKTPCFWALVARPPSKKVLKGLFTAQLLRLKRLNLISAAQMAYGDNFPTRPGVNPGLGGDQKSARYANPCAIRSISTAQGRYPQHYLKTSPLERE